MLTSNACGSGWPPAGIEHRPGEKARDVPVVEASPCEDCACLAAERRRRWSGHETVVDANGRAEHRRRSERGVIEAVGHAVGGGLWIVQHLDRQRHAAGRNAVWVEGGLPLPGRARREGGLYRRLWAGVVGAFIWVAGGVTGLPAGDPEEGLPA